MILLRLIGVLIDVVLLPLRLLARRRVVRSGAWLHVTIDGRVVDFVGKPRFWQVRAQRSFSLHSLSELVSTLQGDARVRGLLVTIRSMQGGMGTATSLRAILSRARAAGKEVVVYLPMGGDTKETYVATAASKIFIGPTAQMAPLGFRSATRYLKSALDRVGVEPQVFACGDFKSAGETLVRDSMSAPQRAQLERMLDGFHEALVEGIRQGRGLDVEAATRIIDEAPYFGEAAVRAGLVDGVAYEDEVPKLLGLSSVRELSDAGLYLYRVKRPLFRRLLPKPCVAVIAVHGTITHTSGAFAGGLSTDARVTRLVRLARASRRVRGVILHIDSPGGSALASDLMHHEIVQLGREKPVVACMANVAASGGYYVAAPAARIIAQPTTITGSIGVVAARLSLDPLLARLGVRTEILERGNGAALLSPMGPLDESGRAALMRELEATYQAFLGVVAAGRAMSIADVERLARGRVYTGKDALDVGLIDALGGFDVALEELDKLLPASDRGRVDVLLLQPPRRSLPIVDPPKESKPSALALLGSLLSASSPDRVLFELAANGEHLLTLAPIIET